MFAYLERGARGIIRPVVRRSEQRHGQLLRQDEDGGDAHVAKGVVPPQDRVTVHEGGEPTDAAPVVERGAL